MFATRGANIRATTTGEDIGAETGYYSSGWVIQLYARSLLRGARERQLR